MRLYFGGFAAGRRFRPYGGAYVPVLRGLGAVGMSARGTPWIKVNGKRALRQMVRQPAWQQSHGAAPVNRSWLFRPCQPGSWLGILMFVFAVALLYGIVSIDHLLPGH
jgi:hypothetical protein